MQSPQSISSLIGEIYEGVVDTGRWHDAIRSFVDVSGGRFAFFAVIDSATATLPASIVIGEETSRLADGLELHGELVPIDPGVPYAMARPQGGVFRFSETSRALTREPETWQDFIRHELGSGDYHSRFSAERDGISLVLALHTVAELQKMTPEQEQLHMIVFDHLQRAVRLANRPPNLALSRQAMLLVDVHGRIIQSNEAAEAILSESDGLTARDGQIIAADPGVDRVLRALIKRICEGIVAGPAEQVCRVRRPSEKRDYIVRLGPLPLAELGMTAHAYRCLIEIAGGEDRSVPDPAQLRALFDLTAREAEVAALFAGTFSDLQSIARHLGISHETARVHARSIYSKLGVANQVELVRLLGKLA